jgi:hypothetical protein
MVSGRCLSRESPAELKDLSRVVWLDVFRRMERSVMPNGRHGATYVAREDLEKLFAALDDDIVVDQERVRRVAEARGLVATFPEPEILVEGQHLDDGEIALVIHFDDWFCVKEDSPVFKALLKLWLDCLGRG